MVTKKSIKNVIFEIKYHFVFCSRYRRKVLIDDVLVRFKELCHEICERNNWVILDLHVMPDTCYLWLECLPTDRPSDVISRIKSTTSKVLREEFAHLNHLESLWTRSFFVSTADSISIEDIDDYVGKQKKKG